MPPVELKIKEPLFSIIKEKSFDGFTVSQLRDVFLKIQDDGSTKKEARLFVYKQILRLLKKELLFKNTTKKGSRDAIYSKTPLFYETTIIPCHEYVNIGTKCLVENQLVTSENENINGLTVNDLKKEVKENKVDLISSISESEEYLRLIKIFPQAREYLYSNYLDASERSSQFIGKIRAAKKLLNYLPEE
jgi:hypothetical protein